MSFSPADSRHPRLMCCSANNMTQQAKITCQEYIKRPVAALDAEKCKILPEGVQTDLNKLICRQVEMDLPRRAPTEEKTSLNKMKMFQLGQIICTLEKFLGQDGLNFRKSQHYSCKCLCSQSLRCADSPVYQLYRR